MRDLDSSGDVPGKMLPYLVFPPLARLDIKWHEMRRRASGRQNGGANTRGDPEIAVATEQEADDGDPSGLLADVDEGDISAKPEPEAGETLGALPVKTHPGLYYQASWGDDLGGLETGEKVQATGEKLYLGVIKQTGDKGFYKITVSER